MKLPKINGDVVFIAILLLGLVYAIFFWPKSASAFPGAVIIVSSNYQQCVDNCLAMNGYTTDTYSFCQGACQYSTGDVVVVGGFWIHGVYYPRGYYHRHEAPRPHYEPRHDHDRGHDHHGHR